MAPDPETPGDANWLAHCFKNTDTYIWFAFGDGMIYTKNPDDETIAQMIRKAGILVTNYKGRLNF